MRSVCFISDLRPASAIILLSRIYPGRRQINHASVPGAGARSKEGIPARALGEGVLDSKRARVVPRPAPSIP